jgi:hypothetical protein
LFQDNIKTAFDLNNIFYECKKNPLKPPKKGKKELAAESHEKSE